MNTPTDSRKDGGAAVAAIIRYEQAAAATARVNKAIGEAIARCSVNAEYEASGYAERFMDGNRLRTHLHQTLLETLSCDSGYGERRLEDHEVEEILSESGCAACLEAWRLVGVRRMARKEFGVAKRSIRAIGRRLLAARSQP